MYKRIFNYRLPLFAAVTLFLILVSSCKTQSVYTSKWIDDPAHLNQLDEETVENMHYSPDAKMFYNIFNDDERLYAVMLVNDQITQKKIMMAGLTFWMDTIAKKKRNFMIAFPLPGSMKNSFEGMNREEMKRQMQNGTERQSMNYAELNERLLGSLYEMEIVGFRNIQLPEIVAQDSAGITASLQFDEQGRLHYQASIPLSFVFSKPQEYLENPDKVFSFGFETGAVDMPMMSSGGRSGGGMKGSGMQGGGMGGGGMGGDMQGGKGGGGKKGGGPPAGMQELSKESTFWVKGAHLSGE